ncbi:hypothetical protein, partial [Caballeronia sp. LZ003]|uniref:hypothetical protein n=1 Tax=Caballeronia sp. LZ003 TaxID=3038559 RepID=UPI002856A90E
MAHNLGHIRPRLPTQRIDLAAARALIEHACIALLLALLIFNQIRVRPICALRELRLCLPQRVCLL